MLASSFTDPHHLRTRQYATSGNLNARNALHERYSTNPAGWHRWLASQIDLPSGARILELGCGPALFWRHQNTLRPACRVTLTDLSFGMLADGRQHLRALADRPSASFCFAQVDARALPFAGGSFDVAIANHMLYHVPDRPSAFREIRRILAPDGVLYAATNGRNHMRDLFDGVESVAPGAYRGFGAEQFGLENGAVQLAPFFRNVTLRRYPDSLRVTDLDPLVAYVASSQRLSADQLAAFRAAAARRLERDGVFRTEKDSGLFVCHARG